MLEHSGGKGKPPKVIFMTFAATFQPKYQQMELLPSAVETLQRYKSPFQTLTLICSDVLDALDVLYVLVRAYDHSLATLHSRSQADPKGCQWVFPCLYTEHLKGR